MPLRIQCPCGAQIPVLLWEAGRERVCVCGRACTVPSLSVLEQAAAAGEAVPVVETAPPAPTEGTRSNASPRFVFLLTPAVETPARISTSALAHYVEAVGRALDRLVAHQSSHGCHVQVDCAVLPGKRVLVDVAFYPAQAGLLRQEFERQLAALEAPDVFEGPVAFTMRGSLWGGPPAGTEYGRPFQRRFPDIGHRSLEQLLLIAAAEGSPASAPPPGTQEKRWSAAGMRTWWTCFRNWLGGSRRTATAVPRSAGQVSRPTPVDSRATPLPRRVPRTTMPPAAELDALIATGPNAELLWLRGERHKADEHYELAIEDYSRALEFEPSHVASLVARAQINCHLGSRQQGLADLSRAIELDPARWSARVLRALVYIDLQAWPQAFHDLDAAQTLTLGREPQVLAARAQAYLGQLDAARAVAASTSALELDPYHEQALALRATAYRMLAHNAPATPENAAPMLRDLERAIEIRPAAPELRFRRAEILLLVGDAATALQECNRALEIDAEFLPAYAVRGMAHQQLGAAELALSDCNRVLEAGVQNADVLLARAQARESLGQVDAALADLDAALELDADNAQAYNKRGMLYLTIPDVDSALRDLNRAVELAPTWSVPYLHRGNVRRFQGDPEHAIADYSRAIELMPSQAMAYLNRGLAWLDQQRFAEAAADLEQVVRLAPDFAPGFFHRAQLSIAQQQFARALDDLEQAIRLDPERTKLRFHRGQVLSALGNFAGALEDYDRVIEAEPDLASGYIARGDVWLSQGQFDRGACDYQEAIRCDPSLAEELSARRLLLEASCEHLRENYDAAIGKASELLDTQPDHEAARLARAAACWYSGQFVEAIDDYSAVLARHADAAGILANRGQAYAELGEFELALEDLNHALELGTPRHEGFVRAYALNGRGLALAGLERWQEAQRDFDESAKECPQNAWLFYNQALVRYRQGDRVRAADLFERALELREPPLPRHKRERARAALERLRPAGDST